MLQQRARATRLSAPDQLASAIVEQFVSRWARETVGNQRAFTRIAPEVGGHGAWRRVHPKQLQPCGHGVMDP